MYERLCNNKKKKPNNALILFIYIEHHTVSGCVVCVCAMHIYMYVYCTSVINYCLQMAYSLVAVMRIVQFA